MKTQCITRSELPFLPGEELETGDILLIDGEVYQIVNFYDGGWIVEIERIDNEL